MTNPPIYPEVDIALLQGGSPFVGPTGPSYSDPNFGIPNDQAQPEVDIALLPGVPNQSKPVAYKHTQTASSRTWTIHHNLNFLPNVTVVDSSGNIVEGDIAYPSNKIAVLTFSAPILGYAVLS